MPPSVPSSSADAVPNPPDPERPSPTSPGPATSPETGAAAGVGQNTHMPVAPELRIDKPDETGRWSALSPAQEVAVFLHVGGMGFADIARRLQTRRQTVSEWFADEVMIEAMEELRGEMREEVKAAFTAAGRQAVYACLLALQMAVKDLGHTSYKVRHSAGRLIDRLSRTLLLHGDHPAKLELSGEVQSTGGVVDALDAALARLQVSLPGVLTGEAPTDGEEDAEAAEGVTSTRGGTTEDEAGGGGAGGG